MADHSLTPTLLLHLGAGVQRYYNPDTVPPESADYDNKQLGNLNAPGSGFPRFGGGTLGGNTFGGLVSDDGGASWRLICEQVLGTATQVVNSVYVPGGLTGSV